MTVVPLIPPWCRNVSERAAFVSGFNLARPPGPEESDAIERVEEFEPLGVGPLRVAVPKDLHQPILDLVEPLPETMAAAAWMGFLRGLMAQAGTAPVHVSDSGRA